MALKLLSNKGKIKVIIREDDAIGNIDQSTYEQYLETLDENLLNLSGEPTRFVLDTHLSYVAQQLVSNQQIKIGEDGKPDFRMSFILEDVRCALCDIENPAGVDGIKFQKENDGFASKELIALLNSFGIVQTLFRARQTHSKATHQKK